MNDRHSQSGQSQVADWQDGLNLTNKGRGLGPSVGLLCYQPHSTNPRNGERAWRRQGKCDLDLGLESPLQGVE
eukprot:3138706-Pleurochrysis_carterae.AAC.1